MSDVVPDNQYYDILLTDMSDGSRITYGHIKYSYPDLLRFLKPFAIFVTDNGKQLVFENKSNKNIKLVLFNSSDINKLELILEAEQTESVSYSLKFKNENDTPKTIVFINSSNKDVTLNI